jgi:predicted nucleotidyltransferase
MVQPMDIRYLKATVKPLCDDFHVKRLDVFGSVAKQTATPKSDIDLIVEFNNPDQQPSRRYFGLLHRLEEVLGTEIDLITIDGLKNPFFKRRILSERVPIYER